MEIDNKKIIRMVLIAGVLLIILLVLEHFLNSNKKVTVISQNEVAPETVQQVFDNSNLFQIDNWSDVFEFFNEEAYSNAYTLKDITEDIIKTYSSDLKWEITDTGYNEDENLVIVIDSKTSDDKFMIITDGEEILSILYNNYKEE